MIQVGFPFEETLILENSLVRLEPLQESHVPVLAKYAFDATLWQWTVDSILDVSALKKYVEKALEERAQATSYAWAIFDKTRGEFIGSTRYGMISHTHKRLQIGWTWLASVSHGGQINAACKYELLRFAFEGLGYRRVEFAVDEINLRSRRAVEKLGARQEGIFRQHAITYTGRIRNTVYYSILDTEWPVVKAQLEERIK